MSIHGIGEELSRLRDEVRELREQLEAVAKFVGYAKRPTVVVDPNQSRVRYREASAITGIPEGTLRSMVHHKTVPHIRVSDRMVLFDVKELEAWMASMSVDGK